MSTSLEQIHEIEPHVQARRAQAGVLLLIIADTLSVLAILAAGGYLSTLNVSGQFRAGDHPPSFPAGLLLAAVLVLSGLSYYWWERGVSKSEGGGQRIFFLLAWAFMIVALLAQIWIGATLGYASPFHAYASLILLLTWYSAFHLLLTAFVGLLLLGRMLHGRLAGQNYIVEAVGYWWYYTAIVGLLMWLTTTFLA